MRKNSLLVPLLVFAFGMPGATTLGAELGALDFQVTTDKRVYRRGEPVRVTFSWTDTGVVALFIPEWRGPLRGVAGSGEGTDVVRDFAVYFEGNARVEYDGMFACGIAPDLRLESKQTVSHSYDVSQVHSFALPGRYVIRAAFFGYPPDDKWLGHWKGTLIHPDVEIRVEQ